ncbi:MULTISPECIES: NUDIX hydrolase [unclassified Ensifer]|uniref:NUDIX hydrolase n=1 Tax=unclassified Ensifer TaxID=2633371 RepID=UPI000812E495|nr:MULTISPECIES: NUDIX hydrolase [unclassified Ensifer]OCP18654.1 hypothetical protein BC361_31770 [Ensifer sp. LC54]OCP18679.1 hypothetical protein BC363_32010 [Ensifer sp. LC384]
MFDVRESWPAEGVSFEVHSIDLAISPSPHPIELRHRDAIDHNWGDEKIAKPFLYNGRLVLQSSLSLARGNVVGIGHFVSYSSLLWWRKQFDQSGAYHLFGFAVIASSDSAIVAIRMGEMTATPGEVYCPAGLLDHNDIIEGKLDITANMRREVREETGLCLDEATADRQLFASYERNRIVVFRIYRFNATGEELKRRVDEYAAQVDQPEIAEAVLIRSSDRYAYNYNSAMHPILDMVFN